MRETVPVDQPNSRRDSEWLTPPDPGPGPLASLEAVALSAETQTFDNFIDTISGGLRAIVGPRQTVVRLEGEIDLSMAAQFEELLLTLPRVTAELVLDVEGLTFCDATLAGFIDGTLERMPVTITHPNRWVLEFLSLVNLAERVRIIEDAS